MNKILFDNEWLQLREKDGWYIYSHSPKSNSQGVVILGYDFSGENNKVLARLENCPVHPRNWDGKLGVTSLSGMIEDGYTISETAQKELFEESGIKAELDKFVPLGYSYGSKSSDYCDHLFAIDLAGENPVENPDGDGTNGEIGAKCIWMDVDEYFYRVNSPTPALIYYRLKYLKYLIKKSKRNG